MSEVETLEGWWIGVRGDDGEVRESYGDRRIVRVGETLSCDGTPVVCTVGMHACTCILDALESCPPEATVIHRVRLSGVIVAGDGGKYAAQHRTVLWSVEGKRLLRDAACDFSERALTREREAGREPDRRLWEAVEVSRRYARGAATREELIAARDAARAVARDAAWNIAWDACNAWAARDAARAAWNDRDAGNAWAAAGAADRDAARDAARAAWNARAATWAAVPLAWDAWNARDAARAAEREWQERHLVGMVEVAKEGGVG